MYRISAITTYARWTEVDLGAFEDVYMPGGIVGHDLAAGSPSCQQTSALEDSLRRGPAQLYLQCDDKTIVRRPMLPQTAYSFRVAGCVAYTPKEIRQIRDCRLPRAVLELTHSNASDFRLASSAFVHPVHSASLYNYLADILAGRTPIGKHQLLDCTHAPSLLRFATACCDPVFLRKHPVRQPRCLRDRCSVSLPRCPSAAFPPPTDLYVAMSNIVTTSHVSANVMAIRRAFNVSTVHLQSVVGTRLFRQHGVHNLQVGELGYRLAFARAIEQAGNRSLLWFDDDILFRRDFDRRWRALQSVKECVGFLHNPGGILLFGASEWTSQAWHHIDDSERCYDAFPLTFGSFGALVSPSVFPHIKTWLRLTNRPLDHVYLYLQQQGFVVRVARPNLLIMDTTHKSTVAKRPSSHMSPAKRAALMRWRLDDFVTAEEYLRRAHALNSPSTK